MPYYYSNSSNQPLGPVSLEELTDLHHAGRIGDDTPVIAEGAAAWQTYRDFALPASPSWTPPVLSKPTGIDPQPHVPREPRTAGNRWNTRWVTAMTVAVVSLLSILLGKLLGPSSIPHATANEPAGTNTQLSASTNTDSWHCVLYKGKKADYQLILPSYFREVQPTASSRGADRLFIGPGGMTIASYAVANMDQFWNELKASTKWRELKAEGAETYQSRFRGKVSSQFFEVTAEPMDGQQLAGVGVFTRPDLAYALTLSVPETWTPRLRQEAEFLLGQVAGWVKALEVKGSIPADDLAKPISYEKAAIFKQLELAGLLPGRSPNPLGNGTWGERPTKAQWKKKLTQNFGWLPGVPLTAQASRFQQIMGKPDDIQTLGDQSLWYYRCTDGTVQLVMSALNLQVAGYMQAEVNDY